MFQNLNSVRVKNTVCLSALTIIFLPTWTNAADYLPLYRFYNTKIHQHEYTNSATEAEQWGQDKDKKAEGILGWLSANPNDDVTRLFRARSTVHGRHYYYTVKPRGVKNIELAPTVMYVYKRKRAGRVAIHGCCLSGGEDMFFTKSRDEVEKVVKDTKNAIGNKRRKFYNAFYILEENPEQTDASQDSGEKKNSP